MLNNFWPWARLNELALTVDRLHVALGASEYRENVLQMQLKLAAKNDARDKSGRFTQQED